MATVNVLFIPILFAFARSQCGIVSNAIVFDYNISTLLLDSWAYCYFEPYGISTTSSSLIAECPTSDDDYIFVGAIHNSSVNVTLGAFAPASVLLSETTSQNIAYRPSGLDEATNYTVYWYNVPGYSFGFSSIDGIYLNPGDLAVWKSKSRLSWNLDESGGYRAGDTITANDAWHKLILYKYCESVQSPTGILYALCPSNVSLNFCGFTTLHLIECAKTKVS